MPMTADELIEKTRLAFEAFSNGDPGMLAAELADDVEWIFPGESALAGTKRGKDEVFEHWGVFGPKLRGAQWRHYLSDGERVVVVYTLDFDEGSCDGADVLTYRDGKIARFQASLDTALMERVFGAAVVAEQ
jgi:ketosteroid isomerase-like protein